MATNSGMHFVPSPEDSAAGVDPNLIDEVRGTAAQNQSTGPARADDHAPPAAPKRSRSSPGGAPMDRPSNARSGSTGRGGDQPANDDEEGMGAAAVGGHVDRAMGHARKMANTPRGMWVLLAAMASIVTVLVVVILKERHISVWGIEIGTGDQAAKVAEQTEKIDELQRKLTATQTELTGLRAELARDHIALMRLPSELRQLKPDQALGRIEEAVESSEAFTRNVGICCELICSRLKSGEWLNPDRDAAWENQAMQMVLMELTYHDGEIDGNPERTKESIKRFQRACGCGQDGVVGNQTRPHLLRQVQKFLASR